MNRALIIDFGLLPVIGALHGWVTNIIALNLLFRPAKEVRVLGLRFQGLLARRQAELSVSIGETVEIELLRFSDIKRHLTDGPTLGVITSAVSTRVAASVREKLPKLLPQGMRDAVVGFVDDRVRAELGPLVVSLMNDEASADLLKGRVRVIVAERIRALDVGELEEVTRRVAGKELKAIEHLGFTMGLAIGILQGLLLTALRALSLSA